MLHLFQCMSSSVHMILLQEARTQRDAQVDMAVPETPLPTEYCGSALGAQVRELLIKPMS